MSSLMLMNPRRKPRRRTTRKRATRKRVTRRRNPVARARRAPRRRVARRRSYRRNPKMLGGIGKDIMPAAIGAGGALALDVGFAALPLPAIMKSGPVGLLAKFGGAIVLGMVAKNFTSAAMAKQITGGALTVIAYGAAKSFLQTSMPQLPLGEYLSGGEFNYNQMGYMNAGMVVPSGGGTDFDYNSVPAQIYAEPSNGVGEYISGYGGY